MKLHEYQAKRLLAEFGIPVPAGAPASSREEVLDAVRSVGLPAVVKAQVHSGGRGKAGGIAVVNGPEEVEEACSRLLGPAGTAQSGPHGLPVNTVLVEQHTDAARELYLGLLVDPARRQPVFIVSARGGMDIEQLASEHPDELTTVVIDPVTGLLQYQARALARALGLSGDLATQAGQYARALHRLFVEKDCSLVEINPLVVTSGGTLLALDAKVSIDDNALFRQPALAALRDASQIAPLEQEAAKVGVSYVKMGGSIGCLVNGAGLAMATMDMVTLLGSQPANFLDVGGAADEERICRAIELLLDDPGVKVAWINISVASCAATWWPAPCCGVLAQRRTNVPFVVRLQGTNAAEARELPDVGAHESHARTGPHQGRPPRRGGNRKAIPKAEGAQRMILVDQRTRLLVQGITGREATFHTLRCLEYGTSVVAGVTPRKGGSTWEGQVPVSKRGSGEKETGREHQPYLRPGAIASDPIMEAASPGLPLIVCITELIPLLVEVSWTGICVAGTSLLSAPTVPG
jgi:succinyl-CoA synthetase beta subunit